MKMLPPFQEVRRIILALVATNRDIFEDMSALRTDSVVSTQRLLVEIIRVLKTEPPTVSCLYYYLPQLCKTKVKSVEELRYLCKIHAEIVGEVLDLPGESYECDKDADTSIEGASYKMFDCIVSGISSIVGKEVLDLSEENEEKDENVTSNLLQEDFHEDCQEEQAEVKESPKEITSALRWTFIQSELQTLKEESSSMDHNSIEALQAFSTRLAALSKKTEEFYRVKQEEILCDNLAPIEDTNQEDGSVIDI